MNTASTNQHDRINFLKNRNLRVLLADDNRVNQFLGKRILQNIGVLHIDLANDGNEAYSMVNKSAYDLILTDVEMPGMNGYQLAKAIHFTLTDSNCPVIIALTANASDDDREQARLAGIDDYLTKPYNPRDLMDAILRHFSGDDFLLLGEMEMKEKTTTSSLQKVYELFHHNPEDVQHFLRMLSSQLPVLISEIKTGISEDQWDRAFQAAHKLKSPVTLLGNCQLASALCEFTEDLRNRHKLAESPAAFENMLPPLESMLVLINTELESRI
jgi:CheY-like chemotaxis protein/HPt (histidine-containing phosphotransfer) domain-containing protein